MQDKYMKTVCHHISITFWEWQEWIRIFLEITISILFNLFIDIQNTKF